MSWYQPSPTLSLELIAASGVGPDARIIDVGGGASTLVDGLLARGHRAVTVLDIAESALDAARQRLGADAARVEWLAADVTRWQPSAKFDLWHDRAVFHFLTEPADRGRYLEILRNAVRPGGTVILATFALNGPERCSGLKVRRYDPAMLSAELGATFRLVESRDEAHVTPGGVVQNFVYCRFSRMAG